MSKVKLSPVEGGLVYVDLMPGTSRAYRWIGKVGFLSRLIALFRG